MRESEIPFVLSNSIDIFHKINISKGQMHFKKMSHSRMKSCIASMAPSRARLYFKIH